MEIERRLHNIENDPKYIKLKNNLKRLETTFTGSRQVIIDTPENLGIMVEFRRNSAEMKNLVQRYKDALTKYQKRINRLSLEKRKLEKALFPLRA